VLEQPALALPVSIEGERGLCGIVLDPAFGTNGYLYAYYTTKSTPIHQRVSRFQIVADRAVAGSETVLLDLPPVPDNGFAVHNGGGMHFGPDGKLYIGVGDHRSSQAAQSLRSMLGKLLRINPDGSIPTDNPFYGRTRGLRRAIYALGLRNPYTFAFQPGTGRLFVNDVGDARWEEVNDIAAGGNYGWPVVEGPGESGHRAPFYAYPHSPTGGIPAWETGCAIVGGIFTPSVGRFPVAYRDSYFTADFCSGAIRQISPTLGLAAPFASNLPNLAVDLDMTPDGRLLYLARRGASSELGGTLIQIDYSVDAPPSISSGPSSQTVSAGLATTLRVSAGGSTPLQIEWMRNGEPIPGAVGPTYTTPPLSLADDGVAYSVRIKNAFGEAVSDAARIHVTANRPPVATIRAPRRALKWRPGQRIDFAGRAVDPEQGVLGPDAFTWWVDLHHDEHSHPFIAPKSGRRAGAFRIPPGRHDSGRIWYRIHLQVRDGDGMTTTVFHDLAIRRFGGGPGK
jgi:glucose/arabinose dehydrogenase